MDKIILTGIEVHAWGGVTEAERAVGQRYRVDLELEVDLRAAGASDRIEDAVDYGAVFALVVRTIRAEPFRLLESVTERVARMLLHSFPVARVTVRVAKLLPPVDGVLASAAVEMARERGEEK